MSAAVLANYCAAVPALCASIESVHVTAASGSSELLILEGSSGTVAVISFNSVVAVSPDAPALAEVSIVVGGTQIEAAAPEATLTTISADNYQAPSVAPTPAPTPAPTLDAPPTPAPTPDGGSRYGEGGEGGKGMGSKGMGSKGMGSKGMGSKGMGSKGMGSKGMGMGGEGGSKGAKGKGKVTDGAGNLQSQSKGDAGDHPANTSWAVLGSTVASLVTLVAIVSLITIRRRRYRQGFKSVGT